MMSELFDEEYQRAAYNRASNKEAIEIGKAEGKAERDKELILKFKNMGMSDEEISRLLW